MALYRENATGFLCEYASNPGAGYTAISAMPTDTVANRVAWWRGLDTYGQTSSWHPSEYRSPEDPAEAALTIRFSREAGFISADPDGTVTDAYLAANTTVAVYRGSTDVTITEGWALTRVEDGCTSTLTEAGGVYTLQITNIPLLATKQGYVRITATRVGVTVVRDFNFIKVFAGQTGPTGPQGPSGDTGPQGTRGSRQILVTTATGAWADLTAWNGIVSQTGTNPVPSDLVTIAKTDGSVATSKFYVSGASPGVWTAPTAYINGSLLVTGTVGANQLAAGSVTTDKLTVGRGGNWLAGSGPTPGAETAYWSAGHNDTGLTATKAAGVTGEYPTGGASVTVSVSGTPASGTMFSLSHTNLYPVMAGQKYEISAYLSGGGLSGARVALGFLNASGAYITELTSADVVVPNASSTLANWARAAAIITAPANATQAAFAVRGICNGGANPKLCLTQAYFGKAGPNQTEFSDWSPSGVLTQIDGSGIKTATITADRLVAGTITAASGVIGSLDASKITTGTLSANYISGGTINGSNVTVTNLNASNITGGTLSVNRIAAGSITADKLAAGTITAASGVIGSLDASKITTGTLSANYISGGTINGSLVNVTNLNATNITTGTLNGVLVGSGVSGTVITTGTLNASLCNVTNLNASNITTGTLSADRIGANTITTAKLAFTPVQSTNVVASINATTEGLRIAGNLITIDGNVTFATNYNPSTKINSGGAATDINNNTTTINGGKIQTGTLHADRIVAGTITADRIVLGGIDTGRIGDQAVTSSGGYGAPANTTLSYNQSLKVWGPPATSGSQRGVALTSRIVITSTTYVSGYLMLYRNGSLLFYQYFSAAEGAATYGLAIPLLYYDTSAGNNTYELYIWNAYASGTFTVSRIDEYWVEYKR